MRLGAWLWGGQEGTTPQGWNICWNNTLKGLQVWDSSFISHFSKWDQKWIAKADARFSITYKKATDSWKNRFPRLVLSYQTTCTDAKKVKINNNKNNKEKCTYYSQQWDKNCSGCSSKHFVSCLTSLKALATTTFRFLRCSSQQQQGYV